ncbi:hypothetical protein BP6252_10846 [Coleophoma cylindrospora]|uniref:SCP domain-containing protein n=1 Tax=Coleophoma cylindrospora TaxID=1849047 RepID=A0A3D8QNK4_9HELO|nr:hypothetical protein BP6252_10846 [Coleophoma cylindrospora]
MLFLQSFLLLLSMSDTFATAERSPRFILRGSRARNAAPEADIVAREPEPAKLSKRACPPGTRYLYHIPGSPAAEVCIGTWVFASCTIIVASVSAVFVTLSITSANWVKSQTADASSAGPPAKKRAEEEPLTWGALYNYTKAAGNNRIEGDACALLSNSSSTPSALAAYSAGNLTALDLDPTSPKGIAAAIPPSPAHQYVATGLEIHEDGFSASFAPHTPGPLERRSTCNEQIHVHYWAAAGHRGTILSSSDVQTLVKTALSDSYQKNYQAACYELDNDGNWSGAYRICYNNNKSQIGCFTCNGHNN